MKRQKEKIGFSQTCRILGKALKVSLKTRNALSLAVGALGFAMAFVPALISMILGHFTDQIQALANGRKDVSPVLTTFAVLAGLFLTQAVFSFLQNYARQADTVRTNKFIRESALKCACDVKYKYIENYGHFKEKIAFAGTYAGTRVAMSIQAMVSWFQDILTFLSVFYLLLGVNPWIVVILLATCAPSVILSYLQKDEDYRYNAKYMKEGAMVIQYFWYCVSPYSMEEVRHWGILNYFRKLWKGTADIYIGKKNKMTRKHVLYNSIADILRNAVYIGVLLIAAQGIYRDPSVGLGVFMLVFSSAGQLQDVTARLLVNAAQFHSDIYYMKDFFDLEELERDPADPDVPALDDSSVTFEHVDFTYPNSSERVLKNISVTIRRGEKIAIVGENGSGKSTFVSLLCGMYEPQNGVIRIGGRDIRRNLPAVRNSISAVFQDFGRYEATLRENITVSDRQKAAPDGELWQLVKRTNAADVIEKQPGKFDEEIGLFSKAGNNLSGGQWQKIAITRAAYRDKARIMVLDEPTAALDPVAEAQLYRDFAALTGDKTTLLISHRLGITSIVDRILVFKNGEIIEDGSHRELIRENGYYAKMYRAQAQWYDDPAGLN